MKVFIVGINGRVAQRHRKAWRELGVEVYGCGSDVDYRNLIEGYDVIDICTPIYLHAPMIRQAVQRGLPVICEKPLAMTIEDGRQLCTLQGKIGIVYQFRYNPKIIKLKKEVMEGTYGEIKLVTASYYRWRGQEYYQKWEDDRDKAGGGVGLNVCIHYFDLFQWIFGYPVEISGYKTTVKPGLDVEDAMVVSMKFPNGGVGSMSLTTHANPAKHFELSVFGTKGHKTIQLRSNEYHKENFEAFLSGKGYVNPLEALKSLRMVLSI